jgi:hypothetical protein
MPASRQRGDSNRKRRTCASPRLSHRTESFASDRCIPSATRLPPSVWTSALGFASPPCDGFAFVEDDRAAGTAYQSRHSRPGAFGNGVWWPRSDRRRRGPGPGTSFRVCGYSSPVADAYRPYTRSLGRLRPVSNEAAEHLPSSSGLGFASANGASPQAIFPAGLPICRKPPRSDRPIRPGTTRRMHHARKYSPADRIIGPFVAPGAPAWRRIAARPGNHLRGAGNPPGCL